MRQRSPALPGRIAQTVLLRWIDGAGVACDRANGVDGDLWIAGTLCELKSATEQDDGMLQFNQLRRQEYELVVFLAWSPTDVRCWVARRDDALAAARPQHSPRDEPNTWTVAWSMRSGPDWTLNPSGDLDDFLRAVQSRAHVVDQARLFS